MATEARCFNYRKARAISRARQIGKAGEHIAAAELENLGADVSFADKRGYDLIAFYDDSFYRIEVKTTAKPAINQGKAPRYQWTTASGPGDAKKAFLTPDTCDIVALVALDQKKVVFRHIGSVRAKRVNIRPAKLDEIDATETWKDAVSACK